MPRPQNNAPEKAKDFKSAIKRLLNELKGFRKLIVLALVLASLGSILSIFAPNQLSKLTDEISKGLVPNKQNIEIISDNIKNNLSEDNLKNVIPEILDLNLNENKIREIMSSNDISSADKNKFQTIINDRNNFNIKEIPASILNLLLSDSNYNNVLITKEDKLKILDENNKTIPSSIASILLKDFIVEEEIIKVQDQVKFLELMEDVDFNNKEVDANLIYSKIDKAPASIKNVIEPFMDINTIKNIVIFLATLYILSALFTFIESVSMTIVSNKFAYKLRKHISFKINKLPLKYFDSNTTGDILSRVTNDVDTIAQSMNQSLSTLVSAITLFIGTIIMMFYTNGIMALTAIFSSLIGFTFMFIILGKSQKYFISRQEELGNLNGHIEEIYSGLHVVKVYNGKSDSDKKFDLYNEKVYEANRKSRFLSGLMMPLMNFIGDFGYVAVCIVGALLALNGKISFGVIVAFITYVRLFTSPLAQIAQAMTSLQQTAAASERVFEFKDAEEMENENKLTKSLNKKDVKGEIEFQNVVFKYDGNESPTIKDFSALAKPGKKIAIVGPTGAGKTTLVNLLMKFYKINGGDIKIDGVSINDLKRENVHELFTMVLQDTWLFNGTIKENIIYNRENVSFEEIEKVCKTVGLDHFIKTLPGAYDYEITDNDSISAGQKQLLTIARGMIQDTPFLILDEATSNVDTRTEELVQSAMDKLTIGKTSFIIAHRLSTIKNADLILVMKDGNIIEQGNHDELMNKKGFYADLYNSQFKL